MMVLRFTLTLCLLVAVGCGLKESADKMRATSDEIKGHSEHLAKRTNDLEYEMAKVESFEKLMDNLDRLFGEGAYATGVDESTHADSEMLLAAGAAVQSMFFQTWKGDHGESLADLDERYEVAVEALFLRLLRYIPRDFPVDIMIESRNQRALGALATQLEQLDGRFREVLRARGLEGVSLYDMLLEALQNRHALERRERLPRTVAKILQWEREATYLLQLRHNTLPNLALLRMSDMGERNLLAKLWVWARGTLVLNVDWANLEELKQWTQFYRLAVETRLALFAMGITPEMNSAYWRVQKGLDFGQSRWALQSEGRPHGSALSLDNFRLNLVKAHAEAILSPQELWRAYSARQP